MAPGVYEAKYDMKYRRALVAMLDSSVTSLHSAGSARPHQATMSNTGRSLSPSGSLTERERGNLLKTMEVRELQKHNPQR